MKLIINADDFGLSKSISDGIVYGIKNGFITSTTVMANMDYARYAISQALKNNIKCVGLHINLTVGKPIIPNKNLTDKNDVFLYNRKQIENPNLTYQDAYSEIMAQIETFNKLGGGRISLDHLDTHHHLLDNKNIWMAVRDIANKLGLPIRNEPDSPNCCKPDGLFTDFTIQNVDIETLKNFVEKNKNRNVTIEIMSHPGWIDDYTKTVTSYLGRGEELSVLEQANKQGVFGGVELISFKELKK